MKITKKKKIFIIIFSIIIFASILYTTVWAVNYKSYDRFIGEGLTKLSYSPNSFVDRSSSIIYGVKKPAFLSFTGNLTCVGEDGILTILIWPSFMSKDTSEIGLMITDDENKISYMIYVNENMEYHTEANKEIGYTEIEEVEMKKLISEHRDEINQLYKLAKEKFGL